MSLTMERVESLPHATRGRGATDDPEIMEAIATLKRDAGKSATSAWYKIAEYPDDAPESHRHKVRLNKYRKHGLEATVRKRAVFIRWNKDLVVTD